MEPTGESEQNKPTIIKSTRIGKQQSVTAPEVSVKNKKPAAAEKIRKKPEVKLSGGGVGAQNIADLFDQLTTLLASGISLLQALEFVQTATKNKQLHQAVQRIIGKIRTGERFSDALAAETRVFDRIVIGMIRAAEASGHLETVCLELARSFTQRAETKNRIVQALSYPALVACVGILTVFVLLIFVVPKLKSVFDLWEAKLPLVTRILLGTADFLSHGGFLIPIGIVVGLWAFLKSMPDEKRKVFLYSALSKIPFLDRLFFLTDFVRLSRTWSMLLRSGVPLVEAVRSSRDVLWNPAMQESMETVREQILRGSTLQDAIGTTHWFPELGRNFLSVGEATGTLDEAFDKIANFYERELDRKIKVMGVFLEPMLILAIGLVVGFLVISLLLPIFEMSMVVK